MQDTAEREALVAPEGSARVWAVQVVPFHCSASGVPLLSPTAVQAEGEVQDTPDSTAPVVPLGAGMGSSVERVPFQPSARGSCLPEASV